MRCRRRASGTVNITHPFIGDLDIALVAADPTRGILSDPTGRIDTINASALGSNDRIDLSGAMASVINGANLVIAQGTTVLNAYGGDGSDLLIANARGSVVHGVAGNDKIDGGSGINTAVYRGAAANYTIATITSGLAIADTTGVDGTDQLTQVQRLQFSDTALAFDASGDARPSASTRPRSTVRLTRPAWVTGSRRWTMG